MPILTVDGVGAFDVPPEKRLVRALTDIVAVDQLHACGGYARCTTCRVEFIEGEPDRITEAEKAVLAAKGLIAQPGLRLSCQVLCDHDMAIKVISRLQDTTRADAGKAPEEQITPDPVWTTK